MVRASILLLLVGCSFEPGVAPRDGSLAIDARATDSGAGTDGTQPDAMMTVDAGAQPDAPHSCGAGYTAVAGSGTLSTYRKVNTPTLWTTAKSTCETDGAHLVIPETTMEAIAVYAYVAPDSMSPYYWAGISDPERDNVWTTVLGATFANPPWATGQPNQRNGEIYVLVAASGSFYDYFNNAVQEYACECEP